MHAYISILRGINVSGQKKILMTDLKALYESLGFKDVLTYIQSGNVIFKADSKKENTELAGAIEKAIFERYDFDVPVIVRTVEEIKQVIDTNPFVVDKAIDKEKLHVTFLSENPSHANLENTKTFHYPPDKFSIISKEVFLHCPINYGETKLSNKFFESKLKVSATTRNWKTVNKLYEMASK